MSSDREFIVPSFEDYDASLLQFAQDDLERRSVAVPACVVQAAQDARSDHPLPYAQHEARILEYAPTAGPESAAVFVK
jgi:hypothetical protein